VSAGERRTYEIVVANFPVRLWVPSQADEPSIHD
jgi:hypothetical protein